ncbi:hypothetical protein [Azohydromonas caseinilytica]|nr:hypothetical protein [Azohydromonas caseinilytica]
MSKRVIAVVLMAAFSLIGCSKPVGNMAGTDQEYEAHTPDWRT